MTYRGKNQTYLCMLVMIFAILVITVPVMASDEIVNCGTPTPTPTPTPVPVHGSCVLAVDATSTGQTSGGSGITIPHTTSGTDRLMLVGISINDDNLEIVASVTYNGVALSKVGSIDNSRSSGDDARVEIWRLIAPATGTHDVVITFSAPLSEQAVAGVMTFTGADQTSPLGPFVSAENDPSPAAVTVSSATGDLVFGVVASEYGAITTDPGQTERWDIRAGSSSTYGAGSTKAGAPSVTLKWTIGCDAHWAAAGVSIRPCSSPTPPPPPTTFTCPASSQKLVTTSGELVGCVAITNDRISLSVEFTSNPSLQMRRADWTWGLITSDIPLDTNDVPVVEKFLYSYSFKDGETSHLFPPVDISSVRSLDIDHLIVSAHAAVEKKNIQTCTWVYSDGTETFKAYGNPKLGSDLSSTPKSRSGTAVKAWAPNADSSLYLRGTSSSSLFTFAKANWIWESYRVVDPWKGDIVDFTKTFALTGTPVSGTLWITADDGYDVSVNGASVGNHGLLTGWRTSDLKYAYVPGHGIWKSVEKFDISSRLVQGTNTLFVQTANRYMGCDNPVFVKTGTVGVDETLEITPDMVTNGAIVGCGNTCAEPKGTIDTNNGALKYEAYICTAAPSTMDAWVLGTERNTKVDEFVKYFNYLIMNVDVSLPLDITTQIPGGASQTITATAFDQLDNRIPGLLLTFSTDFGSFSGDGQLMTAKTDVNGETKVTLTSQIAGRATLTGWNDINGNGILDPGEWTSSMTITWEPAPFVKSMGLSPGEATRQLPGETTQDFTVNVVDQYGMSMPDVAVTFSTDFGSFEGATQVAEVKTDSQGRASATVTSASAGKATVTAKAGDVTALSTVTWLPEAPRVAGITLNPMEATNLLPDGAILALTAEVLDQFGEPMADIPVTFTTTFGSFDASVVTTGSTGQATVILSSTDAGTAGVAATAGAVNTGSTVTWEAAPEPVIEMAAFSAPDPAAEPAIEPASEPTIEPVSEPAIEPVSEPTIEPASEPTIEPASEPAIEPASEPAIEPASEPAIEPASEPTIEPAPGQS
jgi:hypothetical protein